MKPFGVLIAERSRDVTKCINEASALLERCGGLSGTRTITLEQASWLGAVVYLGVEQAKKDLAAKRESNVVTIVASDSAEAKDSAA